MTGISQYKHDEIRYVLKAIVKKIKLSTISEGFQARFHKKLNPNQIRYIKNKYGKDPTFKSPMINYRGGNAADLEDSDSPQEEMSARVNPPLPPAPENYNAHEQSQSQEFLASHNLIQPETSGPSLQTITKGHEMVASLVPGQVQRQEQGIHFQSSSRIYQQPQDLNIPPQLLPAEPDLNQQTQMPAVQASNIAQAHLGWVQIPPSNISYYTQIPGANNGWVQGAHQLYPVSLNSSPVFYPDSSMPISQPTAGYYGGIETTPQGMNYPIQSSQFVDGGLMNQYAMSSIPDSMWVNPRESSPLPTRVSATPRRRDRRHNPYSRPAAGPHAQSAYNIVPRPPSQAAQENASSTSIRGYASAPRCSQATQGNVSSSPHPTCVPPRPSSTKTTQETATSSPRTEPSTKTRRRNASGTGPGVRGKRPHRIAKTAISTQIPASNHGILGNFLNDMGQASEGLIEAPMPSQAIQNQNGQGNDCQFEEPSLELGVDPIAKYTNCPLSEPENNVSTFCGDPISAPEVVDQATSAAGTATGVSIPDDSQCIAPSVLLEFGESPTDFVPVQTVPLPPSTSPLLPTPSQVTPSKPEASEKNEEKEDGKAKGKGKGKEREHGRQILEAKGIRRQQELLCKGNIKAALNRMFEREKALRGGELKLSQNGTGEPSLPRTQHDSQSPFLAHAEYQGSSQSPSKTVDEGSGGAAAPRPSNSLTVEELGSWEADGNIDTEVLRETLISLGCDDAPIGSTEQVVEI